MIPRVVHQFWDGPGRPDTSSWDVAGWEHEVWTSDTMPGWFTPTEQWLEPDRFAIAYNNHRERLRSNIARFELLAEYGGMWADCDMVLVGDLEELLVGSCNVAMFGRRPGTAFIAATNHHPFVESCRRHMRELFRLTAVASMEAAEQAPTGQVTFLDPALVYPNGYWETDPQGVPLVLDNRPRCVGVDASTGKPCGCQ